MSTITVRLPGPFRLALSPTLEAVQLGHKAQTLLTYVAAHGLQGASCTNFIHLLWSRHAEEEARNSLRQCLHPARHSLSD